MAVAVLFIISFLVDWYIYRRMRRSGLGRGWIWTYWLVSAVLQMSLLALALAPKKDVTDSQLMVLMWTIFTYLAFYLPRYIFTLISMIGVGLGALFHRRLRGWQIGAGVACSALFLLIWWGALFNRFNIQINEVQLPVSDLPKGLEGLKIVQFSDLHTGSFGNNTRFVEKLVSEINATQPDLILFTGDIVNRQSTELEPFTFALGALKAKYGVYSVMGNHDYGDYKNWPDSLTKVADINHLKGLQANMGWIMLNNSHRYIDVKGDTLAVIGVENIGDPPFKTYGSLSKAYEEISDGHVKILMTHNPAHWDDSISGHKDKNIALTLCGHTHAMQTELFGLSPAALRYPTWGGLYADSLGRHLYVNIGSGEVGFPARIGATPEITVITLRKK